MDTPYRGLLPYTEEDARFFFGRTVEQRVLLDNLTAARLSVVYGESGTGKSSVLRAGVARKLHDDPDHLLIIYASWFKTPAIGLMQAIRAAAGPRGSEIPQTSLLDALRKCVEVTNRRILIILDQFEEYFQYRENDAGPLSFAEQFPAAALDADLDANFLISMRSDSLALLDFFKGSVPGVLRNRIALHHLSPDGAMEAIEQPLIEFNKDCAPDERMTLEPESKLAAKVITEIGRPADDGSGRLEVPAPYLQLVMTRLWQRERELQSHTIRVSTLANLGGGTRIYEEYFSSTLQRELDRNNRQLAALLFERLATPTGRKVTASDQELAKYPELSNKNVTPLLVKLKHARILVTVPPPPDAAESEVFYQFAHDVLARAARQWSSHYADLKQHNMRLLKWGTTAAVAVILVLAWALFQEHQLTQEAREERDRALHANEERVAAEHEIAQIRAAPEHAPAVVTADTVQGIDVSKFTPGVDWKQVKSAGTAFVYIRATQGTTLVDNLFQQYWKQAHEGGIRRGAFHVYRANQAPAAQAAFFLNTVGALEPTDLPPAVDLSTPGTSSDPSADALSRDLLEWLQTVEKATHRKPLIYGPSRPLGEKLTGTGVRAYPVWVAQYGAKCQPPTGWTRWTFWQFTPDGRIEGVKGSVNLNRFNGSMDQFSAFR
jgi:GH25 family lysozyme M1 (1,4-beta-N-acetylmuramidase)